MKNIAVYFLILCGLPVLAQVPCNINSATLTQQCSGVDAAGAATTAQAAAQTFATNAVAASPQQKGPWAAGTYNLNDTVSQLGITYLSLVANNTSQPNTSPASWRAVGFGYQPLATAQFFHLSFLSSGTTLTDLMGTYNGTFGTSTQAPAFTGDGSGIVFSPSATVAQHITYPAGAMNGVQTYIIWASLTNPNAQDATTAGVGVILSDTTYFSLSSFPSHNGNMLLAQGANQFTMSADRIVGPSCVAAQTPPAAVSTLLFNGKQSAGYTVQGTHSWATTGTYTLFDQSGTYTGGAWGGSGILYGDIAFAGLLTPQQVASVCSAGEAIITANTGVQFAHTIPRMDLLAVGDSNQDGHGVNQSYANTPITVAARGAAIGGSDFWNIARGGQTAAQILSGMANVIYPVLDGVTGPLPPVFNNACTNDLIGGTTASACLTSLQTIGANLHARYPGIKYWAATIPPRSTLSSSQETQRENLNTSLISGDNAGTLTNIDGVVDLAGNPQVATLATPNNYQPTAAASYNSVCYFDGTHFVKECEQEMGTVESLSVLDALGRLTRCTVVKIPVFYQSLATFAATSQVLPLLQLRPHWQVCYYKAEVVTAFAGTSISALTVGVGDSGGTATQYSTSTQNMLATGGSVNGAPNYFSTNGVVRGTFTATGANLSALTAGLLNVTIGVQNIP